MDVNPNLTVILFITYTHRLTYINYLGILYILSVIIIIGVELMQWPLILSAYLV